MKLNARTGRIVAALAVAAFALFVVVENRGVAHFNGANIATFLVVGISLGGIYAISALRPGGHLLHDRASSTSPRAPWAASSPSSTGSCGSTGTGQPRLAFFLVVFVIAPVMGVVLDKVLMQRLRNAALVVQLMVTVGLMLAFMGLTLTIWKPNTGRSLPTSSRARKGSRSGRSPPPGTASSPSSWPSPSP